MIKRHKELLSEKSQNNKKGQHVEKGGEDFDEVAEAEDLSEAERHIIMNSPRGRVHENREMYERMYQDELNDSYLRKYTALSKQMVIDYKKQAINAFFLTKYCKN